METKQKSLEEIMDSLPYEGDILTNDHGVEIAIIPFASTRDAAFSLHDVKRLLPWDFSCVLSPSYNDMYSIIIYKSGDLAGLPVYIEKS